MRPFLAKNSKARIRCLGPTGNGIPEEDEGECVPNELSEEVRGDDGLISEFTDEDFWEL